MIVSRKNKKKILSLILGTLGTSFVIAPMNYLFEKTNSFVTSNLNSKEVKDVKSNNDDVKLSYDNRNSDSESPNGVVNVVNDQIIFTSWFNQEVWRYNVKGSSENNTIARQFFGETKANTIQNIRVKYNVYNDTFLIYGFVKNGSSAFIIQVDANTGKEIIVNNSAGNSLWASTGLGEIGNIVLNESNGSLIILPKFSKFNMQGNTIVAKCDSSTYTPIWLNFSDLTTNKGFTYNQNNDIPETFYVDENLWGFTYFIKGNASTPDKYEYFFFDNNLSLILNTGPFQIGTGTSGGNSSATIGRPLVFTLKDNQGKKSYRIIDVSRLPIYTEGNYNNAFINGTDALRYHTLPDPSKSNERNQSSFLTNNNALSNFVVYQIKKDSKNNLFYLSGFEKNNDNTINFSKNKIKGFKVNNDGNITEASSELVETYTGQKVVTNISIINDKFNKNSKTALIKEVKNYGQNMNNVLSKTTSISSLTQTRYLITSGSSSTAISGGTSWSRLIKEDYKTKITDSIKQKLASDVLETDISNLVKYKNGETEATYVKNELENLTVESGYKLTETKKVMFNNEQGKIKSRVKSNIKKWWYEDSDTSINSSLVDYTDIEIDGFYVINDLMFKLVTSSSVDGTKWTKIQTEYLGKVLPSKITQQNILDDFIVKGGKLNITKDDINITNIDSGNYKSTKADSKKAIEVLVSDKSGTLTIIYDLKSKSSVSMEYSNVIGSYSYIGFLHSALNVPITFNLEKFNSLKKSKLANQFTKNDLLNVLEASSLYDTKDAIKWELTYTYDKDTNDYKKNLLEGKANFTFKYKKPQDFPSEIEESNFTINVTSTTSKINSSNKDTMLDGNNCLTLSNYILNSENKEILTFDQENANLLTGTKELNEVKNNVDSLLLQTLEITNGIFKVSEIKPEFDQASSINKKAIFNLSFKNENITSDINVVAKDGLSEEKLILDKYIKDEINKVKQDYFNLPKITFNYSLVEFNWNYQLEGNSNNVLELSFDELVKKVNEDRVNSNRNPLNINTRVLPSEFVNYFKNKEKDFHTYFPLIASNNVSNSKFFSNQLINTKDPSYYEISKIQMIGNDDDGVVNIRYEIVYPNLSKVNQVYVNPEVKLVGLKNNSTTRTLIVVLLTTFSIVVLFLIIAIPLIMSMKGNKFLNSKLGKKEKRNKLKSSYINKVTKK